MNVFDKFEKEMSRERNLAAQESCGVHHWIISSVDGKRLVKPYRCNTCERCKEREALDVRASLSSVAFLNRVSYVRVKPQVADIIVKKFKKQDYVRFPSQDGYDHIFSCSNTGREFFEVQSTIDWLSIIDKRSDRRRTGLLVTVKKQQAKMIVESMIIRADTKDHAIEAVEFAIKFFKGSDITERPIEDIGRLSAVNNTVNKVIASLLSNNEWLVHTGKSNKGASLPVKFNLRLEQEIEYYAKSIN